MNHAPAGKTRLKPWLAADLAESQQWIVAADPELALLSTEALQAWFAPAREQLLHGYGVVLIRGLSLAREADLSSAWNRAWVQMMAFGRELDVV